MPKDMCKPDMHSLDPPAVGGLFAGHLRVVALLVVAHHHTFSTAPVRYQSRITTALAADDPLPNYR